MKHIKLYENFINEATYVELENAPDEINLEHEKGKIVIDLSVETLKQILSSLQKAKSKLIKLDGSTKITVTDENGDSDRGIGMEWTLGNGEVIYGPDFGVAEDVKSALKSLDKFFKEFEKSFSSLSREDKDYVVVNFD